MATSTSDAKACKWAGSGSAASIASQVFQTVGSSQRSYAMTRTLTIAILAVASILLTLRIGEKTAAIYGVPLLLCSGAWVPTKRSKEYLEDVERARQRAGLTHAQMAAAQELDDAQWNRQRNGVMGQQPGACRLAEVDAHERELLPLRCARHGLICIEQNAVGLALELIVRLTTGKKPMVHMDARDEREKERVS